MMRIRRKPRDLEAYTDPERAAQALEDMAKNIRRETGLVKFSVQFWFYSPPGAEIPVLEDKPETL